MTPSKTRATRLQLSGNERERGGEREREGEREGERGKKREREGGRDVKTNIIICK